MRIALVFASLLLVTSAHANPADPGPGDEMDRFLADKGLLEKSTPVEQPVAKPPVANTASELVVAAMGALGVPYRRGGNTYDSGFDCSGFVRAMYEQTAGLILPRVAAQQAAATQKIERSELQPGDLVFFNTMRRAFSHVGIYVGDYKFIHSPKPGAEVRIEDLRVNYWNRRFDGARRVLAQVAPSQPGPTAAAQASYPPY
jgi:cell wall-associated NlpC family hydrolase